jgi:hypothetical protein
MAPAFPAMSIATIHAVLPCVLRSVKILNRIQIAAFKKNIARATMTEVGAFDIACAGVLPNLL